jgi:mannose-6-phosphate isomerase-like protein (cupin superfamily)
MARVIDRDETQARALLDAVGVRIHAAVGVPADASPELVEGALPADSRLVRAEADIEVPDDVEAGMGAWHVNAVDELHVVRSGEGIMQFVTLDGIVSVLVEAGDVIEIHGAEHRYRPLTPQRWVLRHSGGPDAELSATDTGRSAEEWPTA